MKPPSAWDLVKLLFAAAAFGWRIERWGNGDPWSGVIALFFGVWAVAIAYRLWAQNRVRGG